jgi:WD40 repeat protein
LCEVYSAKPSCRPLWRHPTGRTILISTEQGVAADSLGRYLLANSLVNGAAYLIPLDGSASRPLGGFQGITGGVALSSNARLAAVAALEYSESDVVPEPDQGVIRVWNLETGDVRILKSGGKRGFNALWFLPGERLLSSSREGLLLWDLTAGTHEVLSTGEHYGAGSLDAAGRQLVVDTPRGVTLWDLEKRTERILPIPSDMLSSLTMSPNGRFVVAGMSGGEVWVLHLGEKEPYVIPAHDGSVGALWISPESDRIYTAGREGIVKIWEVPHGRSLNSLPIADMLATLRAQTNLRVVVDSKAQNGYRIVYDRFPGWEKAPAW